MSNPSKETEKSTLDQTRIDTIEQMIINETKIMREKLYEAFSTPFNGRKREIELTSSVKVLQS
jgi:hypothetical protein